MVLRSSSASPTRVLHDLEIGLLLLVERGRIHGGDAHLHALVKLALLVDALGAIVVQQLVERDAVVHVIAGGRRVHRRKREAAVNQILAELVEVGSDGFRSAAGQGDHCQSDRCRRGLSKSGLRRPGHGYLAGAAAGGLFAAGASGFGLGALVRGGFAGAVVFGVSGAALS